MARQSTRISYKSEEEEKKEVTSKDLTRGQLIRYIFDDFLRGFYLVACLFLDGLIIAYMFRYIPNGHFYSRATNLFFSFGLYDLYFVMLIALIEAVVIFYQGKLFRRIWPVGKEY
ncbi:hypothetical protein IX51_02480 [uncultured archaeon]|nr:hypothetical protein IX51_02480 [uncultured archaeon]HKJ96621.1 hypothetical protein [Thermoplasmataceae archaeon]